MIPHKWHIWPFKRKKNKSGTGKPDGKPNVDKAPATHVSKQEKTVEPITPISKAEKTVSLSASERNEFIQMAHAGHIGTREYQQDASEVGTGRGGMVFGVLCDGMGGLEGGELASKAAVDVFCEALREMDPDCDIPAFLTALIHKANETVYSLPVKNLDCGASGTTVAAVVINAGDLYWVSAGDSRIYIIRKGDIVAVTRDHSYWLDLSQQVEQGLISLEDAKNDPQRDALISYLGMEQLGLIDINSNPFALEPGDVILLCSDGLYRSLCDADILEIVECYCRSSIEECARVLPLYALDKGGGTQDNTTVVLLAYQ